MDFSTFWKLIDTSHKRSGGSMESQLQLLIDELIQLSENDIFEFERLLFETWFSAYRADLWEAADVIACGCSDSGFHGFRAWLIAQGRTIFEDAIKDPQSLVAVIEPNKRLDVLDGRLLSVPRHAYEKKTRKEMPLKVYEPPELVGELGEENQRPTKFPLLVAKLGDCD